MNIGGGIKRSIRGGLIKGEGLNELEVLL
jgi:hypothetical protein